MKLDWDCIRAILIALEDKPAPGSALDPANVGHWGAEDTSWHMLRLREAGCIEAIRFERPGVPVRTMATDLTADGYELLGNLRSKELWLRVCNEARWKGLELTFGTVRAIAQAVIAAMLTGR